MAAHVTHEEFHHLENRVDAHDTKLAVQDTMMESMAKSMEHIVEELQKTRWTLIGFCVTLATTAVAGTAVMVNFI